MKYQPAKIHLGKVIRDAAAFNPKNHWDGSANPDSLLSSVRRLFELLDSRKIHYVLVGDLAVLSYIEGRNTEDLDLILAVSALKKLPEIQLSSREPYFAREVFEGLKIDFLLTGNPLFAKVQRKHTVLRSFLEQEIPTATVEGLLLLKLYALPSLYRQGNFPRASLYENDITVLIYEYQPELAQLLAELAQYVTGGDLEEIQRILGEIQLKIERFRSHSSFE